MPAIIAHHLFGEDAYEALSPHIGESDVQRDSFLLGNQGPDPLLCLKLLPSSVGYRHVGTIMHEQATASLLTSVHRHFVNGTRQLESSACKAYALGFVCHYLLDSTVHPLVYAQQYALVGAGVDGLSNAREGREIHALIETELDEHLLAKKLNATVADFSPHDEILACQATALAAISARFAPVAENTYGLTMPNLAFMTSVNMYRIAQTALDSKRDGVRQYADYAKLAGKAYLHIQALTHSATPQPVVSFANDDHVPWPHPFEQGGVVNASFDELYESALRRACAVLPLFAQQEFSAADCAELVGDVNFRGQRIGPSQ